MSWANINNELTQGNANIDFPTPRCALGLAEAIKDGRVAIYSGPSLKLS
jgi:hypothetical protein